MRVVEQVSSTFIEQVAYDTYTHVCVITIGGSDVTYYNVTFKQFRHFWTEGSKGSFGRAYNMYVKGRW